MFPPGFSAPPFDFPGYGPPPGFAEGFPGGRSAGFRPPGRFRISQDASEQAYGLTIELQGTDPAAIQVRPDGRFLVISRERTEQQVQKDSFDDGRGFMRSFSYSTGNTKRRIRVPRDADLSAISREDSKERIRITIPRRPAAESWQPEGR
jgi:HSP20 family molecular chaperone IbpA